MKDLPSWILFLLSWALCTRVVVPITLAEIYRGQTWPEGSLSRSTWIWRALACPEWAWVGFWRAYRDSKPAPISIYTRS